MWVLAGAVSGLVSYAFGQSLNLSIFRRASLDLLTGDELYVRHAGDYFKYSPTFALLFVPFALVPAWLAAGAWGALNFGVAWAGLHGMVRDPRKRERALLFALFGVMLATDGDQSNLLVLGLVLLAARALSSGAGATFGMLLAVAASVKVFPVIAALLVLVHPRVRQNVAWLVLTGALTLLLPLLVVSPSLLAHHYASWRGLLAWDHSNIGWSVMSLLQKGLGMNAGTTLLQVVCLLLLAAPVLLGVRYGTSGSFRRTYLASILVFSVIMNHRAEYATYVIFAGGAALWWAEAKVRVTRTLLVLLAFVAVGPFFTRADPSVTGLFSILGAHRLFHPLRVLPALAVWLWMQRDLYACFFKVKIELRRPETARLEERHAT